jgi:hypothetical protein
MADVLRDPIWQGIGAVFTLVIGLIGFYLTKPGRLWLYGTGAALLVLLGVWIGVTITPKAVGETAQSASSRAKQLEPFIKGAYVYQIPTEADFGSRLADYTFEREGPSDSRFRMNFKFPEPPPQSLTVGINIPFGKDQDLSDESNLEFTLLGTKGSEVDLVVHDVAGKQFSKSLLCVGESQAVSIPLTEISGAINTKVVSGFYLTATTRSQINKGAHSVSISKLKTVKRKN